MFLLTDGVRLDDKLAKVFIQIRRLFQPEMMDVVVARNQIDAVKERLSLIHI